MATAEFEIGDKLMELRRHITGRWWALALRGLLALAFAAVCFLHPLAAIITLLLFYAGYSIADGVIGIVAAVDAARKDRRWGALAFEAVLALALGVMILAWPGISLYVFVLLIGFRTLIGGVLLLVAAFKLDGDHGRTWLIVSALASILFGVALVLSPMTGAVVLTWWAGAFAAAFGIAFLVLAFKLRSLRLKAA
jgi:uncharacterized membrane protein HdeD (DUF308 family)